MKNRRDEEEAHKHAFSPYPLAEAESAEEFYTPATAVNWEAVTSEELPLDRESFMLDIDRMVNEGLGGGRLRKITVILVKVQQIAWFENHMMIRKGSMNKMMDAKRAKAIYDSKDTIAVTLEGDPVWIENVDEANGMATVQVGSRPGNTQTVRVDRLEE